MCLLLNTDHSVTSVNKHITQTTQMNKQNKHITQTTQMNKQQTNTVQCYVFVAYICVDEQTKQTHNTDYTDEQVKQTHNTSTQMNKQNKHITQTTQCLLNKQNKHITQTTQMNKFKTNT